MQSEDFYSDMADAMSELSDVFLLIGLQPNEVQTIARLLILASGFDPDA